MGGTRNALRAAAGLAAAALAAGAPAGADGVPSPAPDPLVRVLLYRGLDPVQVGAAKLAPGPVGLLRDGRPAGRRLAIEGPVAVSGSRYRGRVVIARDAEGISVVNEVSLECYLEGSLLREIYPRWDPQVLRAQAVVSRTYALHRMAASRGRDFDLTAGEHSQVYGGVEAEAPAGAHAVAATRGEVLLFQGEPILAAYHSASGGRTASAHEVWGREIPYLVSVPVEGEEDSPDTYWRIPVSAANLGRALDALGVQVGSVREVRIVGRSRSGRVQRVALRGARGEAELEGSDLRRVLGGLRSTLFEVQPDGDGFVFAGSGHGHGVGMSQWGARAMAARGADYREILAFFYPGTSLEGGWGAGGEG